MKTYNDQSKKTNLSEYIRETDELLAIFTDQERSNEQATGSIAQQNGDPPNKLVKANENTTSKISDAISGDLENVVNKVLELTGVDIGTGFGDTVRNLKSTTTKDGADNFSWHKTGRAVDFNQGLKWVIVEDPTGKDMYFRLYLAASNKDVVTKYKKNITKTDGVKFNHNPLGTKVYETTLIDVTKILEDNGFYRIRAHDGWESYYNRREWWHYENRDGLNWFQALSQLYTEKEIVDGVKTFATNRVSHANRLHREGFPGKILKQIWDNKPVTHEGLSLYFSVGADNQPNIQDDMTAMKAAFLALGKEWYPLSVKPGVNSNTFPLRFTDIAILTELISWFQNDNKLPMTGKIVVGDATHKLLGKKVAEKTKAKK